MPCYDARDKQRTNGNFDENKARLEHANQAISILESYLCAIINELEERDILESVIVKASRNGLTDLVGFVKHHKESDRYRLLADIHKYSIDEQKIIKDILQKI